MPMSSAKREQLKEFAIKRQKELEILLKTASEMVNVDLPGIYAIYHPETFRAYIGQAINIKFRWESHLGLLKKGKHYNRKLQKGWKSVESGLKFVILEKCTAEELNDREHWYIKHYRTKITGYNVRRGIKPKKEEKNAIQ
jgi:group I intron endonuclease